MINIFWYNYNYWDDRDKKVIIRKLYDTELEWWDYFSLIFVPLRLGIFYEIFDLLYYITAKLIDQDFMYCDLVCQLITKPDINFSKVSLKLTI